MIVSWVVWWVFVSVLAVDSGWFVVVLQGFVGYCCCVLILNSVVHAKLLRLVCFLAEVGLVLLCIF